jgi:hypothetical protein
VPWRLLDGYGYRIARDEQGRWTVDEVPPHTADPIPNDFR